MSNWVFKYFEISVKYAPGTKYLVVSIYILRVVYNFTNTIMIVKSHNDINEILQCFMYHM